MPTHAEFETLWDEGRTQNDSTQPTLRDALHGRWPDVADRLAFYAWSDMVADKRFNEREMTNISPEELTNMLATMNFNSDIARTKLVNVLERRVVPWLPVGRDRAGTIYRIVPGAYVSLNGYPSLFLFGGVTRQNRRKTGIQSSKHCASAYATLPNAIPSAAAAPRPSPRICVLSRAQTPVKVRQQREPSACTKHPFPLLISRLLSPLNSRYRGSMPHALMRNTTV